MTTQVHDVELNKAATKQTQSNQEEVDKYSNLLKGQMAPLKVAAAHRDGDLIALKDAISNLDELGLGNEPLAIAAKTIRDRITEEGEALQKAVDDNNLKEIVQRLDSLKKDDYKKNAQGELPADRPRITVYLKKEINHAQKRASELAVSDAAPPAILAMDKRTMTELKSYAKPPPIVHRVLQAAFLLLNEDEEKTSNWTYCQKLCVPDGPNGLNRKMMRVTPDKMGLHELIVKRAQELLKGIDLRTVQKASPGAATFYVWAMSILPPRDDEETDNPGGQESTPRAKEPKLTPEEQKKRARKEHARLMKWIQTEKDIFKTKPKDDAERAAEKPQKPAPRQDYYTKLN